MVSAVEYVLQTLELEISDFKQAVTTGKKPDSFENISSLVLCKGYEGRQAKLQIELLQFNDKVNEIWGSFNPYPHQRILHSQGQDYFSNKFNSQEHNFFANVREWYLSAYEEEFLDKEGKSPYEVAAKIEDSLKDFYAMATTANIYRRQKEQPFDFQDNRKMQKEVQEKKFGAYCSNINSLLR